MATIKSSIISHVSHARYVFINRLVMPVTAFILLILIGYESDTLLGQYALVTTIYYIMQTLPLLGLTPFTMREVARSPDMSGKFYSTIGAISIVGCVFVNIAMHFVSDSEIYSEEISGAIAIIGITIVPGILAFLAEMILISLYKAKYVAHFAFYENLLRLILSLIVIETGGGIISLITVLLITRSIAFIGYIYYMVIILKIKLTLKPDFKILKNVMQVLPAFFLSSILFLVISRFDYLVLSLFESIESIGYYAISYRLFEMAVLVLGAFYTAIFPSVSRAYHFFPSKFYPLVSMQTRFVFYMLVPVVMVATVYADDYVRILFSKQYPTPVLLTQYFVFLLVICGIDLFFSTILIAMDKQVSDLKALSVGALVYIALLFLLIPEYSLLGAFYATFIYIFIQMIIRSSYIVQAGIKLFSYVELVRIAILLLVLAMCMLFVMQQLNWLANILVLLVAFLFYPVMLITLRLWKPLRHLRYMWNVHVDAEQKSMVYLVDCVVKDLRRRDVYIKNISKNSDLNSKITNNGFTAVFLYRVSRYLYLNNMNLFSRFFWQLNLFLTKSDLSPFSDIGPGLVLMYPSTVIISGRVGKNASFMPYSGIGKAGETDVGAGSGMPLIGNDVVFSTRSIVLGGVQIDSNSALPPHKFIRRSRDIKLLD